MSVLRNELIETQKTRTDLIKWKLILVSAILAAAFGLTSSIEKSNILSNIKLSNIKAILCCIPFICAYVDLQCSALYLRIRGIAAFLLNTEPRDTESQILHDYEKFMDCARKEIQKSEDSFGKQSLQTVAIFAFSQIINIFITIYGAIASIISVINSSKFPDIISNSVIFIFGLLGIWYTEWINKTYRSRLEIIKNTKCNSSK
jgi:hypothetical protein